MLLIATTYGMARFGVGLFAPYLAAQRPELAEVLGWAAAAQFTAYCAAAVVAARWVDRHPRSGLIAAGVTAAAGCLGIAVAVHPAPFVVAVMVGGMGGAFASAALVPVIDAVATQEGKATAQAVANTGTAVGVICAGLSSFATSQVGPAWTFMALACAGTAVAALSPFRTRAASPAPRRGTEDNTRKASSPAAKRLLVVPAAAAVVAGSGSALIWTFGPALATGSGSVNHERIGWLWIALGLGGLLGTFTGTLVNRTGRRPAWWVCTAALALASAGIAASTAQESAALAYISMAIFGAGYIGLSGVLIFWARNAWPTQAGSATSVLFIALATGQACGSAGFGLSEPVLGPAGMGMVAAALCAAGGLVATIRPRAARHASVKPDTTP
ncbi:MFS transporter [uncultured Friedmanniella sp.]|uniref:MFS transporter n=1 Tax=uncultured Friedmanniella sp. TaxID=335381 RepID=UPI0035CC9148